MKIGPAFQFYPGDFISSSKVQRMDMAERGAYITLLCFEWQDGSIPDSIPELARMCSVTPKKMALLWTRVSECFVPHDPQIGRLVNPRLELVRRKQLEHSEERKESGKKGAAERWKENGSAIKQPMATDASPSPSLSPSSVGEGKKKGKKQGDYPAAEKRAGRVDLAAEAFAAIYQIEQRNPYGWKSGDFVQLATLRKRLGCETTATPPEWEAALLNYFASPFDEYSMQYFTAKFDTFKNSRLDRFGKPVNHIHAGANGHELDKQQRNAETAKRLLARLDSEDRGGDGSGTPGGHPDDLSGTVIEPVA